MADVDPSGSPPGAIVIGGSINGLNAVRALASEGIAVALVLTERGEIARYSRRVTECHTLPDFFRDPHSLLALLEQNARRWHGWGILPTGDEALELLSRHREALEQHYRVLAPSWEKVRPLLHKDETNALARALGVDLPHVYGKAVVELIDTVRYPVIVKPTLSRPFVLRFGVKLFVAHDRHELSQQLETLHSAGLEAELMDLVPGPDSQFFNYTVFIDRAGQPVGELTLQKLRKSPPFYGVVRAARLADRPELRAPTLAMLNHIGWHGMASAEYKLDPRDGRFRLMEINGRCFLPHAVARAAGINYPALAWREAVLGERVSATRNGWNGNWVHLLDDLYYGTMYRRQEGLSLGDYLASYRQPRVHAVWDLHDPKPALMLCWTNLKKAFAVLTDSDVRRSYRRRVVGHDDSAR